MGGRKGNSPQPIYMNHLTEMNDAAEIAKMPQRTPAVISKYQPRLPAKVRPDHLAQNGVIRKLKISELIDVKNGKMPVKASSGRVSNNMMSSTSPGLGGGR